MRINFIMADINISGGVKAVFEFSNELMKLGHNVRVIYPIVRLNSGAKIFEFKKQGSRIKRSIINYFKPNQADWFDLKAKLIKVPTLSEKYIPDADFCIATWWATAYVVAKYSQRKGEKFYLVQHYETWGGPKYKVDQSYKLGLKLIIHSNWLKNILENQLKVKPEVLILHAPDRDQIYYEPNNFKEENKIRILMCYRRQKWKGAQDGITAFDLAQKKCPQAKLVLFGESKGKNFPKYAEYHGWTVKDDLRKLYNSADIFLFSSLKEGFGMPPLEAMACKVPVVTTSVGAVPDYAIQGKTALVSEPGNIKILADNLVKLIQDKNLREKIGQAGYNYTKNITWQKATEELEQVFKKYHG